MHILPSPTPMVRRDFSQSGPCVPYMLLKFCCFREGAGLENLIYCCNVHENWSFLVAENYAGLSVEGSGL